MIMTSHRLRPLALGALILCLGLSSRTPPGLARDTATERYLPTRVQAFAALHADAEDRPLVLFDNTHAEMAGNADWVIDGGFSDMADDLAANGYRVAELSEGPITREILDRCAVFVLPEPNTPLSSEEVQALHSFVHDGGGLFLIGDHEGADRNNNGWDAVRIFNAFCTGYGFEFDEKWFNDAPMTGAIRSTAIGFEVNQVGGWSATSLTVLDASRAEGHMDVSARHGGNPFVVSATYGQGRVAAIGDSSPFDDGTGNPGNRLHDGYNALGYDFPQLSLNILDWLHGRAPRKVVRAHQRTIRWLTEETERPIPNLVVIDVGHGNHEADVLHTFRERLESDGYSVYYTKSAFTPRLLRGAKLLIVTDPARPLSALEMGTLSVGVRTGLFSLVLTSQADYGNRGHPQHTNPLLRSLGSSWRFNDDQAIDEVANAGKKWGLVTDEIVARDLLPEVQRVVFWSGSTLIRAPSGLVATSPRVLVRAETTTRSVDSDGNGDAQESAEEGSYPLLAVETVGSGKIAVLGTSTFPEAYYKDQFHLTRQAPAKAAPSRQAQDSQQPQEPGEGRESGQGRRVRVQHQTPLFNRHLIHWLTR